MIEPLALSLLPGLPAAPGAGQALAPTETAALAGAAGVPDFGSVLASGLDSVQQKHATADTMAVQAATGDLRDVHDFMIASTEASLATELTAAVRNKAVEAFAEILRMQV